MRCSETGSGVPTCWAKRLTRSSSMSQPIVASSCWAAEPAGVEGHAAPRATADADKRLQLEAAVERVSPGAAWDHHAGGAFDVFDSVSFKVTDPPAHRGRTLTVYFDPDALKDESPLRTVGARCRFRIHAEHLQPSPPGASRELHQGALEDLTVLADAAR